MNNPYKLTLIYLTRIPRSPKGFALAFCLAIGAVMALTGVAMMIRGQSQQTKVLAQKAKAQGVSTAGVAVTQIQQLLSQNKFLAEYNSADWLNVKDTTKDIGKDFQAASNSCSTSSDATAVAAAKTATQDRIISFANSTSLQINPDDATQGKYKMISYTKPDAIPGLGKLIVQGVANTTSNTNNVKEAPSQVVVQIPVNKSQLDDSDAPGLWIKVGDTEKSGGNQNLFAANIWLSDCTLGGKTTQTAIDTAVSQIKANVVAGTAKAIGDGDVASGTTFKDPLIVPYDFPDLPAITTGFMTDSKFAAQRGITVSGRKTGTTGTSPSNTCGINNGVGDTYPRTADIPTKTETFNGATICVYEYDITSITGTATVNTVSTDNKRQKVIFHLTGNVEKGGDISHSCTGKSADLCKATDFQLFGRGTTGNICLNGNNQFEGFIFAPGYDAGVNGGGGGKGGVKGTLWVKTWNKTNQCSSNSKSGALVAQTGKWTELGVGIPKGMPDVSLSSPSSYNTCEFGTSADECK